MKQTKKRMQALRQWAGLRLQMKVVILFFCFVAVFLSGCAEGRPEELRRLEAMGLEQARSDFQKLPPHTQVRIVVWELEHRKPSSSRFDYLLDRNGWKVGPFLLAEAARAKSLDVNVTLLLELADLGRLPIAGDDVQLVAAIARCYELGGQENRECEDLRLKLAAHVLRKGQ